MTMQNYLENKLRKCSQYTPTELDTKEFKDLGIEGFIFKKLSSKKFRKWKMDPESEKCVKNAIHINVSQNKPVQFVFPFGGYKLWRLLSQPEVDWAEFFTIAYYCQWIAPILPFYKPGAVFTFSSDDVVIERMDNISKKDTDSYFQSFQKLLNYFRKHFAQNLQVELTRIADLYEPAEFTAELESHMEEARTEDAGLTKEQHAQWLKSSQLNVCFNGARDLTDLSDREKKEVIRMGPIYHHAYSKMKKRRAYVRGEDKIVVFTTPIPKAIIIGTTKTSITKFWTGIGVIEEDGDGFKDRILSPTQWENTQSSIIRVEKSNLIDLKNFAEIKVCKPFTSFHSSQSQ